MEYTKLKFINQYKSESINPAKTPDTVFEMYSVPIYETGHPEFLRGDEIASNKAVVQKNDILLCKINPRINRVWVVSDESDKMNIASSEWIVIRNSEYNPEFLAWYFRTPKFQKLMTSEVTGIGGSLTRAQPKCVAEYPVPVLDRVKQDEIVAILNKCKFVIESRKQELDALDDLIKARFVELFGDPVKNPNEYYVATLQELIDKGFITYHLDGNHGGDYPRSEEFVDSGVPYISANCIVNGEIDFAKAKFLTSERAAKLRKGIAQNEDVLFAHNATVGPTVVLHTDEEKVILGTSLTAYRCNKEKIMPNYLKAYMLSDGFVRQYSGEMKQTTRNQVPITVQKKYLFLIPPIEEQKQFADFVHQVDKSKVVVQKALDETQLLFDSLMQEYFG
ncbi:MAG: restriction endonuclease subunit S [Lachnobacterium sp.]|nr:restriction endonuclease subunit S [Lachnobacterium sp.]